MEQNHETTPAGASPARQESYVPPAATPESTGGIPTIPAPEQLRREESREQLSGQGAGDMAPAQAVPVAPMAPAPVQPASTVPSAPAVDDSPLKADDIDVIEKEWVDRAKKIIQETKDDPYLKEQEVSRLQADYLQKRFGVQVKLPQG